MKKMIEKAQNWFFGPKVAGFLMGPNYSVVYPTDLPAYVLDVVEDTNCIACPYLTQDGDKLLARGQCASGMDN